MLEQQEQTFEPSLRSDDSVQSGELTSQPESLGDKVCYLPCLLQPLDGANRHLSP